MAVENTSRERFGYTDAEGNRVSALRDMFDGGGRGQRGDRFEGGGLLSSFGNALGGPGGRARGQGFGYTDAAGNVVSPGVDMMNGGGRGMAGSQFEGGLLSAVLNSLGVRPYGYVDPEEAVTAGMDETAPSLMASPAATAMSASMQPPSAMMGAPTMGMPSMGAMPTMPMLEMYAPRGYAGRSRTMPMQGFAPVMDVRPPPSAPAGMNLPVNPGAAAANQAYIDMLMRAAARGNPIRPAASILPR